MSRTSLGSQNLVIVESPAKAKTLRSFLGSSFTVLASVGHIRDLPKGKKDLPLALQQVRGASMGIDLDNNFAPFYIVSPDKKKVVTELKTHLTPETLVWLATDDDREGESIAWHIYESLNLGKKGVCAGVRRILFHEITKKAILEALEHPRDLHMPTVDSQQARRVIDRLVGYELSPLLWTKVRYGLSAGRVQSAVLRILVERERERNAFTSQEYWTIHAETHAGGRSLSLSAVRYQNEVLEMVSAKKAAEILAALTDWEGILIKKTVSERKKKPATPFTTSTLQQEAARKLGWPVKKTMQVAQKLYEGFAEVGGLITYMRTDSLNLSAQALDEAQAVITRLYGRECAVRREYKTKTKGAQEAHEAIRPTSVARLVSDLPKQCGDDERRLYDLIWKRTVASQMADALFEQTSIDIQRLDAVFRLTGQKQIFAGFLHVYQEGNDDAQSDTEEQILPDLQEWQKLMLQNIRGDQHFTEAPPRYTEASLVKKMEAEGIGRPSTYSSTITTLISRQYVNKDGQRLIPTDLGFVVTQLLEQHFQDIVDVAFTAQMEQKLDNIAENDMPWQTVVGDFYHPFKELLVQKTQELKKADLTVLETHATPCPKCGAPVVKKLSRYGSFYSCSRYPECDFAANIDAQGNLVVLSHEAILVPDEVCIECGHVGMNEKTGPFGAYYQCPECQAKKKKEEKTGKTCPKCHAGNIVVKKTKRGKIFFGCDRFPHCDAAFWKLEEVDSYDPNAPVPEKKTRKTTAKGAKKSSATVSKVSPATKKRASVSATEPEKKSKTVRKTVRKTKTLDETSNDGETPKKTRSTIRTKKE